MKERLIFLAWAAPWMLSMSSPLAHALELTDITQRTSTIGLCVLLATTNSVVWLINPFPVRNSFTRPFTLLRAVLTAATAVYLVYTTAVDFLYVFMLTSYLLVAQIFQAPIHFVPSGTVPIIAIVNVAAYAEKEPLWMVWYLALLIDLVGTAHWGTERPARECPRRQDATQRVKVTERARLSTDLHDILEHSLTGITVMSELANRLLKADRVEEAREQPHAVTVQSNEALVDVRRIVAATWALSPVEELEEARTLPGVTRVDADITNEGEPPSGPRSATATRVIREGVTNAIIHAYPSWVRIRLSLGGVTVTNDGYSATYATSSAGPGSGLADLSELVGDEGTLSWGASSSTQTLAPSSSPEPSARSS